MSLASGLLEIRQQLGGVAQVKWPGSAFGGGVGVSSSSGCGGHKQHGSMLGVSSSSGCAGHKQHGSCRITGGATMKPAKS